MRVVLPVEADSDLRSPLFVLPKAIAQWIWEADSVIGVLLGVKKHYYTYHDWTRFGSSMFLNSEMNFGFKSPISKCNYYLIII